MHERAEHVMLRIDRVSARKRKIEGLQKYLAPVGQSNAVHPSPFQPGGSSRRPPLEVQRDPPIPSTAATRIVRQRSDLICPPAICQLTTADFAAASASFNIWSTAGRGNSFPARNTSRILVVL